MTKKWNPTVYIMANERNGTLYTGVTNNLLARVYQHKQGLGAKFTKKYRCFKLVYYEFHGDMLSAIAREKQIKAGNRNKKLLLIERFNPSGSDLFELLY